MLPDEVPTTTPLVFEPWFSASTRINCEVRGSPNPITCITFPLFVFIEKRSPSAAATNKISPSAAGLLITVSPVLYSQSLLPFKS